MLPPIFLIGFPGCGKTTLGRALARRLGFCFIDLDQYIEGRFFCSIAAIFEREGEERFRTIERNMLHEVGEMSDVVIACGGGTPCFFDNTDYILSRGFCIHLQASRERLHERLWRKRGKRPHVKSLTEAGLYVYIDSTLSLRLPFYSRAQLTFESSLLEDKEQITGSINRLLPLLPEYFIHKLIDP